MSQTAAQINQEILDRLNRGDEISTEQVYTWMNRAKRRLQLMSSPMDFMYHEAFVLLGSGIGPIASDGHWRNDILVLPENLMSILGLVVFSGATLTESDVNNVFGLGATPGLIQFPSTAQAGTHGLSTDHVAGEHDLYPLWTVNIEAAVMDLAARGISWDPSPLESTMVRVRLGSREQSPFLRAPLNGASPAVAAFGGEITYDSSWRTLVDSQMETAGYANSLRPGKVLGISDISSISGSNFSFATIAYWRWLPDYNQPCLETYKAPIVTEDIFTLTAEDFLIESTLELAYQYLNDDNRRAVQRGIVWGGDGRMGLAQEFRRVHLGAQVNSGLDTQRHLKEGQRIVRVW